MAGAISLQRQPEAQERLPFVRKTGNSGKNSNGTVHPSGMFSGKKWLYLLMYYFFSPAFTVTTEISVPFVLDYKSQAFSGEKAKDLLLFCK